MKNIGATTIGKAAIKGTEKIIVTNCNTRIFLGVKLIRTIPNAKLSGRVEREARNVPNRRNTAKQRRFGLSD